MTRHSGKVFVETRADGQIAGFASATWRTRDDEKVLAVDRIKLAPDLLRCGIGTAMYAVLDKEACKKGLRLSSDTARSFASDRFWQKQIKKSRAHCAKLAIAPEKATTENREESIYGRNKCSYYVMNRPCTRSLD